MAAQQPERHHYVPAFYLAVFEEPRDRYARPQKPSLRSTPSSRYTLMNASTSVAKVSDIWRRPLLKLWMGLHKHCDAGNWVPQRAQLARGNLLATTLEPGGQPATCSAPVFHGSLTYRTDW